jgi:hypothetical protein
VPDRSFTEPNQALKMRKHLLYLLVSLIFNSYSFIQAQQSQEKIFYKGLLNVQSALLTSDGYIAILSRGNKLLLIDKEANVLWEKDIDYEKDMVFYSMSLIDGNKFLIAGCIGWIPIMAFIDQEGGLIETVALEPGVGRKLLAAIKLDNSDYFAMEMHYDTGYHTKYHPVFIKRLTGSFEEIWQRSFVSSYLPQYNLRYRLGQRFDQTLVAYGDLQHISPYLKVLSPEGVPVFEYDLLYYYAIASDLDIDTYGNIFASGYSPTFYKMATLLVVDKNNSVLHDNRYFDEGITAAFGICGADSNLVVQTGRYNDDLFVYFTTYQGDSLKLLLYNSFPKQNGVAVLSDGHDIFVIGGEGTGLSLTNNFLITIPIDSLYVSVPGNSIQQEIPIRPNPFQDYIYLDGNSFRNTSEPLIEIYSLQGTKVYAGILKTNIGDTKLNLDFLNSGVYILTVILDDNKRLYNRIVKF